MTVFKSCYLIINLLALLCLGAVRGSCTCYGGKNKEELGCWGTKTSQCFSNGVLTFGNVFVNMQRNVS